MSRDHRSALRPAVDEHAERQRGERTGRDVGHREQRHLTRPRAEHEHREPRDREPAHQ
jgi:hypothetical protein